ncbi:MAG: hypothetical protein E3J94_07305 [Desulfobacteraceae bacterium]|nr:MAG: hypothetical protein E3J94_07060 [Desulfobacteraceae bacterium]TES88961.1 MAG: hypothetical protein E3J94_07305 [Desulfobacteraceae bacterium]
MVEIVKLRDKSGTIQLTVKEALENALNSKFKACSVVIILHSENEDSPSYEYWNGGGQEQMEMLWHIEQFKAALLEGRLDEYG